MGIGEKKKNNEHAPTSSLEQPFLQRTGGNESGGPQQPHGGADDRRTNTEAGDISPDYQPQVKQRTGGPRVTHDIIERYSNALGDKRWYYAEILSFGCSLLVGAMEGIPDEHCQPRAVVAAIATILQCGLSCLTVVPLELCLQLLLSVCVVPMALIVVARVFDASTRGGEGSDALEVATAVLITAANLFGIALLVLAVAIGVKETLTSREGSRRAHVLRFEHRSATTGEYPSGGGGARCPNETSQVETIEHRHQQQQVSTPPTGIPAAFIEGDGRGLLFEDGDDNGAVDILPLARSSSSSSLLSLPGPAIEETVTVPPNPSPNQARPLPVGKGSKRKGKLCFKLFCPTRHHKKKTTRKVRIKTATHMSSNFWLLSAAILAGCASAIDVINAEDGSIRQSTFGITYADKNEENRRSAIFASNIAAAREASDANPLASFGITRFSDKSPSELSAHEQHSVADAEKNGYDSFSGLSRPGAANVSRVDWREKGAVTPVKDIGMCGGPYRYAVAANIESSWFISGHPLTPLSTQSFVSCARDPPLNCHTGDKKDIHKRILEDRKGVVTTEAAYPDDADKGLRRFLLAAPTSTRCPSVRSFRHLGRTKALGRSECPSMYLTPAPWSWALIASLSTGTRRGSSPIAKTAPPRQ